jgi:hypothetical protein
MSGGFVLDANVLFSARLRDLWLQLAVSNVARIVLTDAIELEWTAASSDEEGLVTAAGQIRARLREPTVSAEAYAASFALAGCREFSVWLLERAARL